ncbi:MAG: HAD-IA family hydrolase [Oscillospiraceae bacterium]|nr:HAD-IA family hydrolase [Oscillospiraceae bacterium]
MKYQAVIFDMDGTLLDTLGDLTGAVNHTLEANGYPKRTAEEVRAFIGNGARVLIRLSLPEGTAPEEVERILREYQAYYLAHPCVVTCAYPGMAELVARLEARGVKTAIVSNKPDATAKALGERFFPGMLTVGDDGVHPRKPAPDNVYRALEALGVPAERTAYVGDSEVDGTTAHNAGIDGYIVGWGFRDKDFLLQSGITEVLDTAEELLEKLL